nr:MAG TPA: hypothetical protein [Bacteriophage sp.]
MIPDFKVGDRVYDIQYGWGAITAKREDFEDTNYRWGVTFDNGDTDDYTIEGKYNITARYRSLSFTEYDLVNGGFSQERKINYHDYVGKWGKFSNSNQDTIIISKLQEYNPNTNSSSGKLFKEMAFDKEFYYFEPLTEQELCKLNLNGTDI